MDTQKFNFKNFAETFKRFFSNLGKVAAILTAIASGYAASEIYHRYDSTVKAHKMQDAKTSKETSVAINERGELMVIDRGSGTYQMFDNQVGQTIFNLYASKIYLERKQ